MSDADQNPGSEFGITGVVCWAVPCEQERGR